jgi:hypothetical protein
MWNNYEENAMSEKTVTILFPPSNGEVKRGPFFTGRKYAVPADLADEFVRHGAQLTKLGDKESHEPQGADHAEAVGTMRKHIDERATAAKSAKVTTAAAVASAPDPTLPPVDVKPPYDVSPPMPIDPNINPPPAPSPSGK